MRRALRSNFEIGSPRWAGRRAQWKALGLTDADMEKPKIAVVNSSSELSSCFSHLDGVAAKVKDAVRAAGGLPFEIRTAAPSDFITSAGHKGGYILPSRDLIVNDIEVAVEGALLDGMVCLASCDKTTPGQLMAAGRLNIPSIVVICGYQQSGEFRSKHVDIEEVFLAAGHVAAGKMSAADLAGMSANAVRGPGVCAGMGTANSMHIVCEALGMALPGSSPVLANSPRMNEFARRSGERIVQMVWDDVKPRDILTAGAFANASAAVLALSGSINAIKHLQAIAIEACCDIDVYALFERFSKTVPMICAVRPNGEHLIEDLEAAGGALAVLKRLEPFLDTSARNVAGGTLADHLRGAAVLNDEVIRPLDRPFSRGPSIAILRGSLAPEFGIVKLGISEGRTLRFEGTANAYQSREAAIEGLQKGEIKPGQVVVLRGMGVLGGPGMAMASAFIFALDGSGMGEQVAVITDGQLSGLVNKGLVVGELSPEAAAGGPLALVENGDRIVIDVPAGRVDLEVPEAELASRRARLRALAPTEERGWLNIYQRVAGSLARGAVMTSRAA